MYPEATFLMRKQLTLLVCVNRNLKRTQNHIEGLRNGAGSDCFIYG